MIKRKCSLCNEVVEIFEDGEEDIEIFICGVCNINPNHRKSFLTNNNRKKIK